MGDYKELKNQLIEEINKLHERHEFSKEIKPDFYEPGMMEYLEETDGIYNENTGNIVIKFESKGVRYEGRTDMIERLSLGDPITVERDKENKFNSNNFVLLTKRKKDVGYMPATLCNAIAPLYDDGQIVFDEARVSFIESISQRSRYAKQPMLFVELKCHLV